MRPAAAVALILTLPLPAAAQKAKPAAKPRPRPAQPARKPAPRPAPAAPGGPDLPSRQSPGTPFAIVNNEVIPVSVYIDRLSLRYGPEIREQIIFETLLSQEAARRKLTPTAKELDAEVARAFSETIKRYGDEKKLAEELAKTRQWTVADYKAVIRDQAPAQVTRQKLGAALVKPQDVKDAEIDRYYSEQKQLFTQPDTVRISHVLVRRPADGGEAADNAARAKAEELFKKIRDAKGANFDQVARESSEDRLTGGQGGKLPFDVIRGSHPFGSGFEAAVFSTPAGLVDQVVATPDGYHVVRVDSRKEGRIQPLAEVKEQIRSALLLDRRAKAVDELLMQLRAKAQVQAGRY